MAADRELDAVLYGATGFVGKYTAEYLVRSAPEEARIGLAGRSQAKLGRLRAGLGERAADWPLIVADSQDAAALLTMAQRTKVIATTVGPYATYGMDLVEACAKGGTHYADLTGETLFMRATIEGFDAAAKESGARIVHGCGFDSIPSDIGVLLLHEAAGELEETTLLVRQLKGGASGGTVASAKATVDAVRAARSLAKVLADPYALSPDRGAEPDLGPERDLRGVERSPELGAWFGPFVMASINTRIVRRSNALQGWAYGRRFRYREVTGVGSGPLAPVKAAGLAGGLVGLAAGLAVGPTRKLLDRVLPDPGEGPSEAARTKGFFRMEIHGRTA